MDVQYTPPVFKTRYSGDGSSLERIRRSVYWLYKRLTPDVVNVFSASIQPQAIYVGRGEDVLRGTKRVVEALVNHLRLPDAQIGVTFDRMTVAGQVTLGAGPRYYVRVAAQFAHRRADIGAILAHEVMHVFLERHSLRSEDEILTDTAAVFLGVGWPLLNSQRRWNSYSPFGSVQYVQRLGYLDISEYGYVLGKRSCIFGENISAWLTSGEARDAYTTGCATALAKWRQPPLTSADMRDRRSYEKNRKRAQRRLDRGWGHPRSAPYGSGYRFTGRSPMKVTFACPACEVNIKIPVEQELQLQCEICRSALECAT